MKKRKNEKKFVRQPIISSSRENLDYSITTTADDPTAVTAPGGGTYALTTHQPVARDLLGAVSFFKVPEAQAGIVARRNEFPAIRGQ